MQDTFGTGVERMKKSIILICLIAAYLSGASAAGSNVTLTIDALIDGRDQLTIMGDLLCWHHFDYAAVGRHVGLNEPTKISTAIDGTPQMDEVLWWPTWPEDPPAEILYEAVCVPFSDLVPALPPYDMIVDCTLTDVQGRGPVTVTQVPPGSDPYKLIIEFDDNLPNSHAWYMAQIDIEVIPEPATVALLALGSLALLIRRH
jgi:hypothetical protein